MLIHKRCSLQAIFFAKLIYLKGIRMRLILGLIAIFYNNIFGCTCLKLEVRKLRIICALVYNNWQIMVANSDWNFFHIKYEAWLTNSKQCICWTVLSGATSRSQMKQWVISVRVVFSIGKITIGDYCYILKIKCIVKYNVRADGLPAQGSLQLLETCKIPTV